MKVYILTKHTGSYSDYSMENLGVFASRDDAEKTTEAHRLVSATLCAFQAAQMEHREEFNLRKDFDAVGARERASMLDSSTCTEAFEAHKAACIAAGVVPPKEITDYIHDEDPHLAIEEHDIVDVDTLRARVAELEGLLGEARKEVDAGIRARELLDGEGSHIERAKVIKHEITRALEASGIDTSNVKDGEA